MNRNKTSQHKCKVCVPEQHVGLHSVGVSEVEGRLIVFQEAQELFGIKL